MMALEWTEFKKIIKNFIGGQIEVRSEDCIGSRDCVRGGKVTTIKLTPSKLVVEFSWLAKKESYWSKHWVEKDNVDFPANYVKFDGFNFTAHIAAY